MCCAKTTCCGAATGSAFSRVADIRTKTYQMFLALLTNLVPQCSQCCLADVETESKLYVDLFLLTGQQFDVSDWAAEYSSNGQ